MALGKYPSQVTVVGSARLNWAGPDSAACLPCGCTRRVTAQFACKDYVRSHHLPARWAARASTHPSVLHLATCSEAHRNTTHQTEVDWVMPVADAALQGHVDVTSFLHDGSQNMSDGLCTGFKAYVLPTYKLREGGRTSITSNSIEFISSHDQHKGRDGLQCLQKSPPEK